MSKEFDNILNDCLERMTAGEDIQECIGRYPQHEQELGPLLIAAAATMRAAATPSYRPEARARGLDRLTQALAQEGAPRRRGVPALLRRLAVRPVAVGFAAALLAVVAAGGTTVASSDSVPGEPLYWVKTTKENLSLKIPRSDMSKARAHAHLASVRSGEMRRLIARGRFKAAEQSGRRLTRHLNASAVYARVAVLPNPNEMPVLPVVLRSTRNSLELRTELERDDRLMRSQMVELMGKISPGQRHRVRLLRRRSELGYRILIDALYADESAGPSPFWRTQPSPARDR